MNLNIQIKKWILCITTMLFVYAAWGDNQRAATFNSFSEQLERLALSNVTKAWNAVDSICNVRTISNSDNLVQEVYCIYWKTLINYNQGKSDSTILPKIGMVMQTLDKNHYPFEFALLGYTTSSANYTEGDYAKAFVTALQVVEQCKQLQHHFLLSKTLVLLGNICSNIGNYNMAEDYYNQALALTNGHENEYRIKMNRCNAWFLSGQKTIAVDSLEALAPIFIKNRDTAMLVMLYLNLGSCYSNTGDFQKFGECCEKILPLIPSINNNRLSFGLYQDLGVYYMYTHEPKKALNYFYLAQNISLQDGNLQQLSYTYLGLSNLFEKIGAIDSSLIYLKRHKEINDKKIDNTKLLESYRAYISVALESTQKELTITTQKLQLRNRSIVIIIGSALAIIWVISLFLIVIQQKKRIKESENKDLEEQIQSNQLMEQLQKERIEAQAREITSHALMLSNKNQVLQQIAEEVKHLPNNKEEVRKIEQIIKSNLKGDQSWDNVIMHFEKVHPDFFNKINALSNGLTENNLRLCAYLRIGIPLKQIAQMLNVSHGSILIQRYRLKKKLGLSEEQDLDNFIRNI